MVIAPFTFARIPELHFGAGSFRKLGAIAARFGGRALLVTGEESLNASGRFDELAGGLEQEGISFSRVTVRGEPSPDIVDGAVGGCRDEAPAVVVAVGGGSVIDAGKAISAMLPYGESVLKYLEGVGTEKHHGCKIPFVAVPTTAGTGSEATKNAVLSRLGEGGFKKSLRHDHLVPDIAVVDPELMLGCPSAVTAACGMDAFSQLVESFVSTAANPMTDALARDAFPHVKNSLLDVAGSGAGDIGKRSSMAYAAFVSGITLANAGLGTIHGFASVIGGKLPIPHGVVCGALLGPVTELTIQRLQEHPEGENRGHLEKYAALARLVCEDTAGDTEKLCAELVRTITQWTKTLGIPKLGTLGIREADIPALAQRTGNKANPVTFDAEDLAEILRTQI